MNILKKRMNNKGAVEMSLNLIIMLVIGLTVLGLIIAFVTSFLGEAEDGIMNQLTPDDTTQLDQVKRQSGNFVFAPSNLEIKRGEDDKLYVKFENPFSEGASLFDGGDIPLIDEAGDSKLNFEISGDENGDITVQSPPVNLQSSEITAFPMIVSVNEVTPSGNYFLTFNVEVENPSDSTDIKKYSKVVTLTID